MEAKFEFGKKMESFTDEQLKKRIEDAYTYQMPLIRTVPYVGESGLVVTYDCPEVIGRCPVTGIADVYRVVIDFVPGEKLPELKTLKFYFMGFLDLPISHEHLCSKIYKEFNDQVQPLKMYVRVLTAVRGGIWTNVTAGDLTIVSDIHVRHVGL